MAGNLGIVLQGRRLPHQPLAQERIKGTQHPALDRFIRRTYPGGDRESDYVSLLTFETRDGWSPLVEVRSNHPAQHGDLWYFQAQWDPGSQAHTVLGVGNRRAVNAMLAGVCISIFGMAYAFYVKPALLAGSLDNVAAREEIFGPVAYLTPFHDEEEAVRLANKTDYGLANSVWTKDLDRAYRVAEAMVAGNSWINAHNLFPHGVPYAGVKKSGLGGGVLSAETLLDYWRSVSVVRPL